MDDHTPNRLITILIFLSIIGILFFFFYIAYLKVPLIRQFTARIYLEDSIYIPTTPAFIIEQHFTKLPKKNPTIPNAVESTYYRKSYADRLPPPTISIVQTKSYPGYDVQQYLSSIVPDKITEVEVKTAFNNTGFFSSNVLVFQTKNEHTFITIKSPFTDYNQYDLIILANSLKPFL